MNTNISFCFEVFRVMFLFLITIIAISSNSTSVQENLNYAVKNYIK